MTFGEFVNQRRKMQGINFARFCNDLNIERSNWFNVERNLAAHPRDKRLLNKIADYLKFDEDARKILFNFSTNGKK